MVLTFIGIIQLLIGSYIVLAGRLQSAFLFLLVSGLFGGSAAINLPALGGSSIPPVQLALVFATLRVLLPRGGLLAGIPEAFDANKWLILFVFYGVALAFLGPRIFAGQVEVFPMSYQFSRGMFDTLPLQPTAQNITASAYYIGVLLACMVAYLSCRYRDGEVTLVRAALWISWLHIAIGVAAIITRGTPADVIFEIFRNANYAQLDDTKGVFVRIRGIWSETSSYTAFAFSYFVLHAELWYKSFRPKATGITALALLLILFFTTSSTAYVGILAYMAFITLRAMALPRLVPPGKIAAILKVGFALLFACALMLIAVPALIETISEMLVDVTVGKSDSKSTNQRLFWAGQGWRVFFESYGIGIGPGSFRSSSMVTAMMGSVGIIGCGAFLVYVFQFLQPLRRSTYTITGDSEADLAGSLGTAALISLVPQAVSSPSSQPSLEMVIFASAAIALRARSALQRAYAERQSSEVTHAAEPLRVADQKPAG